MRCLLIDNPGPQSRLLLTQQEIPNCHKEQVLVQVKATALNRADLMQRQGKYAPPAGESEIPGLEVAGEIVAIGKDVSRFKIGDKVYGLVGGGGYAEYCCVHQNLAERIPDGWDYAHAAALPEALITAHATVFLIGRLKQNQTLLIHAASSGVSCLAIQMASHLGAKVISTTSDQLKMEKAKQLGATMLINYKIDDFETLLGEQSINLVVDYIGGSYFPKHLRLLKLQGRLVQIATMQGHLVDCDLAKIMRKRLQINGFVLRAQTTSEKAALWKSAHHKWSTALLNKHVMPVIDSEFKFEDIEQAHARMQSNEHFGKIVVQVAS